jgi:hypothetical protein
MNTIMEHDVLDQERPDPEDAELHQRRGRANLDEGEDDQEHDAGGDAQPGGWVAPAPHGRLLKAEHAEAHTGGDQHDAPVVHARRLVLRDRLGDEDQDQRDHRHRDVHPEDRPPGPLREVAPEDRADRGQPAGDAEEDGERPAPFTQGEGLHDDRQRGREHDRPARSLDHAERHDPGLRKASFGGEPAQRGRGGEHDDAERDHPAVTDGVGESPAEREQGSQRQQVGVDSPLHAGVREAELLLHFGRGDRHDRLIDEGHRDGEDHRRENQVPGSPVLGVGIRHLATSAHSARFARVASGPRANIIPH